MPHLKETKPAEPLWKEWDSHAQKKGIRHTVYAVNGDEYTGEWLDNKKDGKLSIIYVLVVINYIIAHSIQSPYSEACKTQLLNILY